MISADRFLLSLLIFAAFSDSHYFLCCSALSMLKLRTLLFPKEGFHFSLTRLSSSRAMEAEFESTIKAGDKASKEPNGRIVLENKIIFIAGFLTV